MKDLVPLALDTMSRHFCLTPKVRMVYVPQIWLLAQTVPPSLYAGPTQAQWRLPRYGALDIGRICIKLFTCGTSMRLPDDPSGAIHAIELSSH